MPVQPNAFERLLLRANVFPAVLQDLLGAALFRVVGAALELDLFERLAAGPRSAGELAEEAGASEEGVTRLLEVLASAGYVRAAGGRFALAPAARKWLLRHSPQSILPFVDLWQDVLSDLWQHLGDSVRHGGPALHMHDWLSQRPDGWAKFNAAMRSAASTGADEVARRLPLRQGARRLLDVGGSHGLFTAAICRRHPQLTAVIFDLPKALVSARATIAATGLGERVEPRPGDMTKDDFGTGYDAVLLFNVVHYFSPAENLALLRKAAAALEPGGVVALLDQLAGHAPLPSAVAFVRVLSLQYFATLGSRVYGLDEISSWLREAGFGPPRRRALRRTPGQYLVWAEHLA